MTARTHPVDAHVGEKLRLRRTLLGMSQTELGNKVELTFQQIQKYERGANRISASKLYMFSELLDVPVSYFFEDLDGSDSVPAAGKNGSGRSEADKLMTKRETLELVRAYYRIDDPVARKRICDLVRTLGGEENQASN